MGARCVADRSKRHEFPNGAVGFPAAPPSALAGPFAAVYFCPIEGVPGVALTCYATKQTQGGPVPDEGGALLHKVPACTKHKGKHLQGHLITDRQGGVSFRPNNLKGK